jgi:hypothetical protein
MKKNAIKFLSLFASLMLVFFFNTAFSQSASTGKLIMFRKGRLTTIDGKRVKFYILNMDDNISEYKVNKRDSAFIEIPTDKILKIEKKIVKNTATVIGAGAAAGFLIGGSIVEGSSGNVTFNRSALGFMGLTTATGTVVGVFIWFFENLKKKYIAVYDNNKETTGLNSNP